MIALTYEIFFQLLKGHVGTRLLLSLSFFFFDAVCEQ